MMEICEGYNSFLAGLAEEIRKSERDKAALSLGWLWHGIFNRQFLGGSAIPGIFILILASAAMERMMLENRLAEQRLKDFLQQVEEEKEQIILLLKKSEKEKINGIN